MEEVGSFLRSHRVENVEEDLTQLGVEILDDLRYIDEEMLEETAIKLIHRKRILEAYNHLYKSKQSCNQIVSRNQISSQPSR